MKRTAAQLAEVDFAALDDARAMSMLQALDDLFVRAANDGEVDAYLEVCAPDIEFQSATARADGSVFHGHDGMREYFRGVSEVFDGMEIEVLEIERPEPNRLRSRNRWRARGRGSGAVLDVVMRADVTWVPGVGATRVVATIDPDDDLGAA